MSAEIIEIMEQEIKAQKQISLRKFAEWLMEGLSKDGDSVISHSTIGNWKKGKPPETDFLEDVLAVYPVSDRRFHFALNMLAAKSPHVWGFGGVVWRLKRDLTPKTE